MTLAGPHSSPPRTDIRERIDEIRELETRLVSLRRELLRIGPAAARPVEAGDTTAFVLLRAAGKLLAVGAPWVQEVVAMVALSPLPEVASSIAGLLNYHGEMLAVVDLAALMGVTRFAISPDQILAVCAWEEYRFSLLADEALDVVWVREDEIRTAEEILPGALRSAGVVTVGGQPAVIIDVWSTALSVQAAGSTGGGLLAPRTSLLPPPTRDEEG